MTKSVTRKRFYIVLEVLSLLSLAWAFRPVLCLGKLGDVARVPIHFNHLGEVDGWGGKGSMAVLPILTLVIYAAFSLLAKCPEKLNYPRKTTDKNKAQLYIYMGEMMRALKVVFTLLFAYVSNLSFDIARGSRVAGGEDHVPMWIVGLIFVVVTIYVAKMIKCNK